jgi:hypothetical protein
VRHPARHQIEHHSLAGDPLAVELRQPLAEGVIKMLNEPGLGIEQLIVAPIPLATL